MINKALFSSNTDEWETPQAFFDDLDKEFHFTLDVCASDQNHKCARYFTKEQDGLQMDWGGGHYLVQSALWPRNWKMGTKVCQSWQHSLYAITSAHRHKMVSRLHLSQIRNQIYKRTAQIRRREKLGSVSEYACDFQWEG